MWNTEQTCTCIKSRDFSTAMCRNKEKITLKNIKTGKAALWLVLSKKERPPF
jgi:hypothetical protein